MKNTTKRKTKGERRIEILKDALSQIKANKYKVTNGTYVELSPALEQIRRNITGLSFYSREDISAKECLLTSKDKKPCKVCAKGAIFLSLIRKENKVMMSKIYDGDVREESSNKLFGEANLNRMEAAFEKWYYKDNDRVAYGSFSDIYTNKRDETIVNFVKKHPKSEDRLIAIIKNAIKNDGIFKPQLA